MSNTAAAGPWQKLDAETDSFNGITTVSAMQFDNNSRDRKYRYVAVRCDNAGGKQNVLLTFDVDDVIATPNSHVRFYVKVDNNEVHTFPARIFRDSYTVGYTNVTFNSTVLKEIANGNTMKVRVDSGNHVIDFTASLNGSSAAINHVKARCA